MRFRELSDGEKRDAKDVETNTTLIPVYAITTDEFKF